MLPLVMLPLLVMVMRARLGLTLLLAVAAWCLVLGPWLLFKTIGV